MNNELAVFHDKNYQKPMKTPFFIGHSYLQLKVSTRENLEDAARPIKIFPIEITIGGKHGSLELCFETRDQQSIWYTALKKATGYYDFYEFYTLGKLLKIDPVDRLDDQDESEQ